MMKVNDLSESKAGAMADELDVILDYWGARSVLMKELLLALRTAECQTNSCSAPPKQGDVLSSR